MIVDNVTSTHVNVIPEDEFDATCYKEHRKEMINIVSNYKYELRNNITFKKIENDLNEFIILKKLSYLEEDLFEL